MSWLEVIILAIEKLSGHAKYKDLYSMIEDLYSDKVYSVKDFKSQVRGAIGLLFLFRFVPTVTTKLDWEFN